MLGLSKFGTNDGLVTHYFSSHDLNILYNFLCLATNRGTCHEIRKDPYHFLTSVVVNPAT